MSGALALHGVGYLTADTRAQRLCARVRSGDRRSWGASRLVIFLTQRCNMRCGYCLSIGHEMPPWRTGDVRAVLEAEARAGARHVQWTGGEASLHPHIVELVGRAGELGLTSSMSTNGTAPRDRMIALVQAGLSRVYLSLDTPDPRRFDRLTGSRGMLPRVLQTLEALVKLRDAGADLHVTLNAVLSNVASLLANDARDLNELLDRLIASGADDFKLLPDSTTNFQAALGDQAERFVALCRARVPARFGMFHYRLAHIDGGGHGFHDARPRRCYQALDDRAWDSIGAYGCVIQIREGGEPVFLHTDAPEVREEKLATFVSADRYRDPICRRCCFDIYRDLNERVTWLLERLD